MGYEVKLRQFDTMITVEPGDTVLQTALDQGLDYPCGCQSGNCGSCKSVLRSGDVEMAAYSEFALSDEEKASGLILACRAMPTSDCEITYLEPDEAVSHPRRLLDCRVVELTDLTHDIKRVRLSIEAGGPFSFSAGQYAKVTFGDLDARDYSMANLPDDPVLEFHIRAMDGGDVSHYVADKLKVGDKVRVDGPYGVSYLRESHRGPIIAVGGGSGLAPIKAIVERALQAGLPQEIKFYIGMRDERDVYMEDAFKSLQDKHPNLNLQVVLSEPSGETVRRTGFLCDVLKHDFTDLDGAKAYLAGPPIMVETCVAALETLGARREDCHADAFYSVHELAEQEAS
ncbi:MAG: 2Fe-2S iron-sulfur cluster-binding protein [Minwuiales bacterium]|nr:2Fe-2S iron-sulfur cluster-binding protein [Minwuiales bacterium]